MPSLSHASRMFTDRRDLFHLPILPSGGKAAGSGAGKGIPAPKNAAAPRPGPPPVAAPAQAPAHAAAPAPAPAPTAGPGTPAPVAPKWGSGATAADIVRGGRPQPPAPQVRPRSLIPSQQHRDRFFGFYWIYQTIRQTTQPHTKPIHPLHPQPTIQPKQSIGKIPAPATNRGGGVLPKPGSKPLPRPLGGAHLQNAENSLAGSIHRAQSDAASGKSLPTPNLGGVPAPNAHAGPNDGWGKPAQMSHQSGQSAGGAFGYGFGPGSGGVNAATDSMGDLSVQAGGSGAKGVGMDGGLGLQFGNFGAMGGGAGGMGGDFGFGFGGAAAAAAAAGIDQHGSKQQDANPYGNVYGAAPVAPAAPTANSKPDAVKLPDDLSKDGASPSGQVNGAGVVPPYAAYGNPMGAYNYMMPPQMAVPGAEAYGAAAYGAYGAAAASNGYGGDSADYYRQQFGGGGAGSSAGAAADGTTQSGTNGTSDSTRNNTQQNSQQSVGSNAASNAAGSSSGAMAGAFSTMPNMGAAGYPYMGYPYMTPGMPPAAGYAVQSPYYGYPQANMYAAAGAYGQQSAAPGAQSGGGKSGKGGYGGYGGNQRSGGGGGYGQPPAPPAPPAPPSNDNAGNSQFGYNYGNYSQSAYGR